CCSGSRRASARRQWRTESWRSFQQRFRARAARIDGILHAESGRNSPPERGGRIQSYGEQILNRPPGLIPDWARRSRRVSRERPLGYGFGGGDLKVGQKTDKGSRGNGAFVTRGS